MDLQNFKNLIDAAGAKIPADLVIKNGQLVNVMTKEIYPTQVAIYQNKIVAVDEDVSDYIDDNTKIFDAQNKYILPGFIDGHIHVECSKLSMTSFSNAVIPHGTTSIVSGLDEYISVVGTDGLEEIFAENDNLPLKTFWGSPYKTPYTMPKSTVAFNIDSSIQAQTLTNENCYGVWELVREAVMTQDEDTLKTLLEAQKNHQPIFGCSPMAQGVALNQYLASGVRLDHESYDHKEMLEKVRKGLYVIIRESSVTHFLEENIKTITEDCPEAARFVSFCSDDVTASDLLTKGHIDHIVRLAIKHGVDPITAIQMATINSAQAYQIESQVGSVSPGRDADILLVDDLNELSITDVFAKGTHQATNYEMDQANVAPTRSQNLAGSIQAELTTAKDFEYTVDIDDGTAQVTAIKSVGPFVRHKQEMNAMVKNHIVQPNSENDLAMVAVLERYGKNGNKALAFATGWGLKKGAMASSSAADDNNIIALGTNSADMSLAVNTLIENGGGQVIVVDGKIINLLRLPVAGITSDESPQKIAEYEQDFFDSEKELGSNLPDPMFYMSFLSVTAIPDIAITDVGLTDCIELKILDPIISTKKD
ncbi:adenine deaminase C-terminal domain-containing protein [Lactobacillus sp. YT155]|uniref:adenine deaminase C-terminal domain-containing protein n=1 Tax=Lactobacillus sp. YT155 TaxID=3060955 RepID=UPI00265DAF34|nr:adenine deaminase C-terminal domain-containing protein [Lactobacillus sp. YT155]MDO1605332.1 adenine deaminase C-terminal domain-containing protein [Lactobacillus sp. YT155]